MREDGKFQTPRRLCDFKVLTICRSSNSTLLNSTDAL